MFQFTSVIVNSEMEQDDSHYTENGNSTYQGMISDHGSGEMGGRREGRRRRGWEERMEGEKGRRRRGGN